MRVVPGERQLDEVVAEEARTSRDEDASTRHAPQVGVQVPGHDGEVAVAHLGGAEIWLDFGAGRIHVDGSFHVPGGLGGQRPRRPQKILDGRETPSRGYRTRDGPALIHPGGVG